MGKLLEQRNRALDDINAGRTVKKIRDLESRVRELEEENARLRFALADTEALELGTSERLAASQAYAEQLRKALGKFRDDVLFRIGCSSPYRNVAQEYFEYIRPILSLPTDTSALDAYVSEKVKEARPNFRQMREMLPAMQAGELTVSRGIEILDMWHAGKWNDNMLPPVRQDLIEEDSMPVEIIDRCNQQIATLSRQRDLVVEAIRHCIAAMGSVTDVKKAMDWPQLHNAQMLSLQALDAIKESEGK